MDFITNTLYWLSTGLLVPVTILLLFFFARSLFIVGGFYKENLNRSKFNKTLHKDIEVKSVCVILEEFKSSAASKSNLSTYLERIKSHQKSKNMLDKILGDYEVEADRELGASKLLVKIGPMLGLMGTLIPMGPALVGLATGDVASMASNMQVAFATTVVGIIIGAVGFVTLQVKQRWVIEDLNALDYIVESLKEE
ncbi:MAG: MotA/TolQ/ExbB proton channel family protein [Rikenellaceae bacterium]